MPTLEHNALGANMKKEDPMTYTDVILVRVGPDEEGGRERRRDWNGGLQQPNGLNCPQGLTPEVGYRRCHGETIWWEPDR